MKKWKARRTILPFIVFGLLFVSGAVVFGQRASLISVDRPDVKISLTGIVERSTGRIALEEAGLVNPGEIVDWTIRSHNSGKGAAHHYSTIGVIPSGTIYLSSSAHATDDARIVYSIDQGKTYEARPMIEQKQPDGSVRKVPAPVSLYTHIRFQWETSLNEGKQFSASYKVRVK